MKCYRFFSPQIPEINKGAHEFQKTVHESPLPFSAASFFGAGPFFLLFK